ncbi:MAG: glycoside hydrolase family 2 TIM barrel-domain containing protein [Anaerolineales bacterium]
MSPMSTFTHNLDFNPGWLFYEADLSGAERSDFDDSDWRRVDLPHDWSVEDYPVQDESHIGPFFKEMENGHDTGYLRGGVGWYRKRFTPPAQPGQRVWLHFDGVQTQTTVYVNGQQAGNNVYGYTPFNLDITPFLRLGEENLVAIKAVQPEQHSRWFSGAGIYRPVTLSVLAPVHIAPWGLAVSASVDGAVTVEVTLSNAGAAEANLTLKGQITGPGGERIPLSEAEASLEPGQRQVVSLSAAIPHPVLWTPENPNLYRALVWVEQDGERIDAGETTFGLRSIEFSAEKGFLLNGQPVLMKGACLHHDNGLLGAAAFEAAETRRVRLMKENGYNAIRCSHNPPSQAFLDACDRLGMLVIDETFDAWHKPKRPNDYHRFYPQWWQRDTEAMLLRDRNHPCVVMWSIGNEIEDRSYESGYQIAREAIAFVKSIDPSRAVTMAVCDVWDNREKTWEDLHPIMNLFDVCGYNYQEGRYRPDHEKYPRRIIYASESMPPQLYEHWKAVKELPYVIGDFVWVGMDYLGEAGVGHATYETDPQKQQFFFMPWPWYIVGCGDLDILGDKKPQSYYRDVVWENSRLELAVHEPIPDGHYELVHFWGWPREEQSWNWDCPPGTPLEVKVYSSYPRVRLELNGVLIGEQDIHEADKFTARFSVPYQPGELKAYGLENGAARESKSLVTAGPVERIALQPESERLPAGRGQIGYLKVVALDSAGRHVPNASLPVEIRVSGAGELLAAGNGSVFAEGSLQSGKFRLYRGRGLAIVRSNGQTGEIQVEARWGEGKTTNASLAAQ